MLIRAYGELWNPDIIDWGSPGAGNKGKLIGIVPIAEGKHEIDFFEANGIYVLYNEYRAVYVGKADDSSIGSRLRTHLSDRLAGRWDMFSWYSITKINKTTKTLAKKPESRGASTSDIIATLEALAILISEPAQNRKREGIPGATEAVQKDQPNPMTIRAYLQKILDGIEKTPSS